MINPRTVMVGVPCHDGRNMSELTGMLVSNKDLYCALTMPAECSHPSLVRNIMADTFLRSGLEWFVGIDSDIVPSRRDFELLLEPIDQGMSYFEPGETSGDSDPGDPPQPTRIEASVISHERQSPHGDHSLEYTRGLCDVLVCAEYAYKRDTFEPVQFGGGFYRVHKSVFSILANLEHPDNGRVEMDATIVQRMLDWDTDEPMSPTLLEQLKASVTSTAGTPRLWQCTYGGRMFYDFFPSGAMLSAGLPHGDWKGEDHGFWTLCSLAGLIPRVERRTRLIHIGRKGYAYIGSDEGGGQ